MSKSANKYVSSSSYTPFIIIFIIVVILSLYFYFALDKNTSSQTVSSIPTNSYGKSYPTYPKVELTPGDVIPTATKDEICQSGYAKTVRAVTVELKKQVYIEYGLNYPQPAGDYEVDHFISLELGGSNDIKNLWPEPASPKPGFHEKDAVENYLHDRLCKGIETLNQIQSEIRGDWVAIYNQMGK